MIIEILAGILIFSVLCYVLNRLYFSGGVCKSRNRLDGKVAVITGANIGIGYETALELAKRGARIIMACRDLKRSLKAADAITQLTGNLKVEVVHLDLADLSSVRKFAASMNSNLTRLDLLVNNAGIMMCPNWRTKDGFEMQFGVNHLGHFLLTNLLLDLLKKTVGSRVITVSSLAHNGFSMNWNDLNWEKSYNAIKAYSQSKLANILFTKELAKRLEGSGVTAVCLHPGAVRTELMRYCGEGLFAFFPYFLKMFYWVWAIFSKSANEGAQTTLHCALDDEIPKYNGYYFSDCKPVKPSRQAMNREDASRLWEMSAQMVQLE